jgi:hypothetical protein
MNKLAGIFFGAMLPRAVRLLAGFGVVLVCALATVGCSHGPEDAIVGIWKQIDGTEVLQFFESGDVVQEDSGGSMGAHYRFVDDAHMRVDFGGPAVYAPPRTYQVDIDADGNTLALTDEAGKTVRYRRSADR